MTKGKNAHRIPSQEEFSSYLLSLPKAEFDPFLYVHALGATFATIAIFEHTLIQALWIARGIKIDETDGIQTSAVEKMIEKREYLYSKTLGNVIRVLVKNDARDIDIAYLKFLQSKRDFFIHRFFANYPWPGDIGRYDLRLIWRKLRYLEIIFGRAADRVWDIIGRNGYADIVDLGPSGRLMVNHFDSGNPFVG
jgi:hypothetical protein